MQTRPQAITNHSFVSLRCTILYNKNSQYKELVGSQVVHHTSTVAILDKSRQVISTEHENHVDIRLVFTLYECIRYMYLLVVGFLKNPKNIFSQYKFWEKVLNVNILLEKSIILRPVNIVQNVERFSTLRCCLLRRTL